MGQIRRDLYQVLAKDTLDNAIFILIIINAFTAALHTYRPSKVQFATYSILNFLFESIFAVECIVKLLAFHPRGYWQSHWNKLDFILVIATSLAFAAEESKGFLVESPIDPQFFRSIRCFRTLRLIKSSPK